MRATPQKFIFCGTINAIEAHIRDFAELINAKKCFKFGENRPKFEENLSSNCPKNVKIFFSKKNAEFINANNRIFNFYGI